MRIVFFCSALITFVPSFAMVSSLREIAAKKVALNLMANNSYADTVQNSVNADLLRFLYDSIIRANKMAFYARAARQPATKITLPCQEGFGCLISPNARFIAEKFMAEKPDSVYGAMIIITDVSNPKGEPVVFTVKNPTQLRYTCIVDWLWSPDSTHILVTLVDNSIHLLNIQKITQQELKGHAGIIGQIAVSNEGKVVVATAFKKVFLWRYTDDGYVFSTFIDNSNKPDLIGSFEFTTISPQGNLAITSAIENVQVQPWRMECFVWNLATGQITHDYNMKIKNAAFSADDSTAAIALENFGIAFCKFDKDMTENIVETQSSKVAISADGTRALELGQWSDSAKMFCYDLTTAALWNDKLKLELEAHYEAHYVDEDVSESQKHEDWYTQFIDNEGQLKLAEYLAHSTLQLGQNSLEQMFLSDDGHYALLHLKNGLVIVHLDARPLDSAVIAIGEFKKVAFNPNGRYLLAQHTDGTIFFWDLFAEAYSSSLKELVSTVKEYKAAKQPAYYFSTFHRDDLRTDEPAAKRSKKDDAAFVKPLSKRRKFEHKQK